MIIHIYLSPNVNTSFQDPMYLKAVVSLILPSNVLSNKMALNHHN